MSRSKRCVLQAAPTRADMAKRKYACYASDARTTRRKRSFRSVRSVEELKVWQVVQTHGNLAGSALKQS